MIEPYGVLPTMLPMSRTNVLVGARWRWPARPQSPSIQSMSDSWASSEHARLTMRANRARDTAPEIAVRSLLHTHGRRYRTHYRPVPGLRRTADIAFTRLKVVAFIDGCFWHGCPQHFVAPKTNSGYWGPKIEGNVARDRATDQTLSDAGWTVMRFWERRAPNDVADQIERHLAELHVTIP